MRKELDLPQLPILIGGLGDFLSQCTLSENMKNYPYVNEQLKKIAREYPNCGFVSAEGLGANPDNLHFSAAALDVFGVRYYKKFVEMGPCLSATASQEIINFDSERTEMEEL